jgi:hypothetical protein
MTLHCPFCLDVTVDNFSAMHQHRLGSCVGRTVEDEPLPPTPRPNTRTGLAKCRVILTFRCAYGCNRAVEREHVVCIPCQLNAVEQELRAHAERNKSGIQLWRRDPQPLPTCRNAKCQRTVSQEGRRCRWCSSQENAKTRKASGPRQIERSWPGSHGSAQRLQDSCDVIEAERGK